MRAPDPNRPPSAGQLWLYLALLWLAGNGLRITILAVPPVIPLLTADLHMSATEVGILGGLPAVLFACAAIPGSLLIARFGALPTLVIGLFATAAGSALRGAVPDVALLFVTTVVTAFGVAVMQPALPPLVRAWLPHRIGFGTAVYTNGLLVGEIIPVTLTGLLVLPLVADSWRWSFVVWAVPAVLIGLIITVTGAAPRRGEYDCSAAAMVAELARPADLAAWADARERQCGLLRDQHVHPLLFPCAGRGRPGQPRAVRAQCRSVAGIVRAAGGRR